MSHKLQDITLYYFGDDIEIKRKITGLQNIVSQLYVHFLNGYKPKGTSRISVTLSDNNKHFFYAGSILNVHRDFDIEHFCTISLPDQKQTILDTVHGAALACADKYGWDKSVFEQAYQSVVERSFEFKIESERKTSKNRSYKASTIREVLLDRTIIYVRFYDKQDQLLKEVELLTAPSNESFYGPILKHSKWLNNTDFGFTSKLFSLYTSIDKDEVTAVAGDKSAVDVLQRSMATMHLQFMDFNGKAELLEQIK